jgi:hypothetical protein
MPMGRMRFWFLLLIPALLVGCFPAKPRRLAGTTQPARNPATAIIPAAARVPETPAAAPLFTTTTLSGITFEGVAFDSRNHRLHVVDQTAGPGTDFADAEAATRAHGAIVGINAGFFTPEGSPLGLVVSNRKSTGSWNNVSSLGSGVWCETSSGKTGITRREALGLPSAKACIELIQAGPLIRENGRSVGGLDSTKTSARTLILSDGGTRWWIGRSSPCSLLSLGQALSLAQPAGWPVRHALNLDGGRSSDLWVSGNIPGGPVSRRTPWNRPVRNFLVLISK